MIDLSANRRHPETEGTLARLLALSEGSTALFRRPQSSYPRADLPSFAAASTVLRPGGRVQMRPDATRNTVQAHGSGLNFEEAMLPALAEALERFCAGIYLESELIQATAEDLAGECLDLDTIPTISTKEAEHPKCPLKKPSKQDRIRWVRGVCLSTRKEIWLPAIMVFSALSSLLPGEHFWFPISTGCAAHSDIDSALLAGLFEVVERDAIALTWLQKLALTEIRVDTVPDGLKASWGLYQRASVDMEFRFYDATTDLKIPVVYGLRRARQSATSHTMVGCSAGPTLSKAIDKVMRDLTLLDAVHERPRELPLSFDDFRAMWHGASYMAHSDRSKAFDFLLMGSRGANLSSYLNQPPISRLDQALELLREQRCDVYAVDLTTDEAKFVDMKVIRVIIPALQPLSFAYTAQFKGNPRLYTTPAKVGHETNDEDSLNEWPQPFF